MATPEEMAATMIQNLKEKTGRSLEEFIKIVKESGYTKHREIINFLKADHGMTHGYANLVAHKARDDQGPAANSGDTLVDAQYSGAKAVLRPIYDAIIASVQKFGADVEIAPKKAYVSLRRKKQFAIVQPSTKTRVDVGININEKTAGGRLEISGSFNAMVSHRVKISGAGEVDDQLTGWLKEAYEEA
jgi:hypothetical protein